MLLPFLISCFTFVASQEVDIVCKTCIKVDSVCHNISYLFQLQAPFRESIVISKLEIHRSLNTLYFAFEPNITDPEYYKIGYVNLDTPVDHGILEGGKPVTNFRTLAIDQDNNVIFIGGGDAIYILNNTDKAAFYSSGGDTIVSIFFKTNLYFVRFGENKIVEKRQQQFRTYDEYIKVKNFVIDRNNVLVYLNTSGLYATKFYSNDTVYLSKNAFLRGLTVDLQGTVYAWWIDGIYKVNIETDFQKSNMIKVADINQIGALTFDNDNNFLFSSNKGLFRLTPSNATIC